MIKVEKRNIKKKSFFFVLFICIIPMHFSIPRIQKWSWWNVWTLIIFDNFVPLIIRLFIINHWPHNQQFTYNNKKTVFTSLHWTVDGNLLQVDFVLTMKYSLFEHKVELARTNFKVLEMYEENIFGRYFRTNLPI